MVIHKSGAKFSSIVTIGEKLKKLSTESGLEYLYLNRGVNAVCNINLKSIISKIDFNSARIQTYPPNAGFPELREAINKDYFNGESKAENIYVAPGGMSCLDLILKTLDLNTLFISNYYWGSYKELATAHKLKVLTYEGLTELAPDKTGKYEKTAIVICEPNNPTGDKHNDDYLFHNVEALSDMGMTVIIDCPYRKLFFSDSEFYTKLMANKNVIITESFSKCMGLSGQRIGFVHSTNEEFNNELNINILYSTNGTNAFAQELVLNLLTTEEGKAEVTKFREKTAGDIAKNISWLKTNNLLYDKLYENDPIGIFVIVNKSTEELLKCRIGSVPLSDFCKMSECPDYARICVSVPHEKFVSFFKNVINI
jgi:aspartate/methionine/tyrosine aminotransferase